MEAEPESHLHLDQTEPRTGNCRNGRTSKDVQTSSGPIPVETPRDRFLSFEPELIRKLENIPTGCS
ncbi:MAG: transposase [Flavobacterium sp.]|nr:transposase [Pedobacter sp.]